jgi:TPR repeat protein
MHYTYTALGRRAWLALLLLALVCGATPTAADHVDEALLARAETVRPGDLPALERRAAQGDAEAAILLGEVHHRGRIVPADDAIATGWFTLAAETGVPLAQYWLARKHDLGATLSHDQEVAAEWYRRAAEQGYAAAQNRLGELYEHGLGVDQDFSEALTWYRHAAEQRHPAAEANLAAMHYHGRGVDRDYRQAYTLFQRAARDGNQAVLLILGNMVLHGLGTAPSLVDAYGWFSLASRASGGSQRHAEQAEQMLDKLELQLNDAQIGEALARSQEWQAGFSGAHE